jgi:hypothetical protein
MRFKGTLILLIIVLALGAYVYFYEIKGGEQREKAKESENQVWKLEDRNIQQIDLISAGEHIAAARKGEREWVLTVPRQLDADSDELSRIASSASSLRRESVLDQNVSDLAKFGLDPAQSSLKLKTKDGKEYGIDFGNNNPSGNFAYAAIPHQKAVFLIPTPTVEAFKKKLDDLRDHSVLRFQQPEAQSITIRSSKGDVDLIKDNNDRWWFNGAEKRAADSPRVRGILNALSMGKIKEFFNDNPQDYADPGFDKPIIDVRLTYGKDKAIKHLIIGTDKSKLRKKASKDAASKLAEATPELYLAKDDSRPDLFFVEKDIVDKLLVPPDSLREKALIAIQRWDVDSIILTNTKGSFSFVKTGGEWYLAAPKKKAKWDAISGILDAMEKPVKGWVDKPSSLEAYGLDKPKIHIVLKQGTNILADCSFGKAAKDGIFAQVKGDSAVKVADPLGLDLLDRGEADMVELPATSTPKK